MQVAHNTIYLLSFCFRKQCCFSKKYGAIRCRKVFIKIISRIYGCGRGWVFTKTDFVSEFSEANIHQALSSLTKAGKIRRICRGVYDYPRYNNLLDRQLSPDLDQVAHALARKFNWRIQPSGDAALNLLGFST